MKKRISTNFSIIACGILNAIAASSVYADDICNNNSIPADVKRGSGCQDYGAAELPDVIIGILNAIIGAASIVAVVFIVIGGINYMTSSGDATKVKKAKDTILYACIGLIVCALSFAIVNWVIKAIS